MHCLICKKKIIPGKRYCPEHESAKALFKSVNLLKKQDFEGRAPNVFIGSYGYPNINIGLLSPPERKEDAWLYDDTNFWSKENFDKFKVIALRSSLINSKFQTSVKNFKNKFVDLVQEVGMASKPVDIDFNLVKRPYFKLNLNKITLPSGPKADLRKAVLVENPKIERKVDKIVSDTDLKANNGLQMLYEKGVGENFLTKLLSVGNLGLKKDRKFVPTKWSITATQDIIGKHLISKIKDYKEIGFKLYIGEYMNNHFCVMFFPDVWGFELFETFMQGDMNNLCCTTDYENYNGRKNYAKNCTGGYYSARMAVLEKLDKMQRKGSVFVLRLISPEYDTPLGVWVVLEAVRKTLQKQCIEFSSREEMINYLKMFVYKKFKLDVEQFFKKSKMLNHLRTQKKLTNY